MDQLTHQNAFNHEPPIYSSEAFLVQFEKGPTGERFKNAKEIAKTYREEYSGDRIHWGISLEQLNCIAEAIVNSRFENLQMEDYEDITPLFYDSHAIYIALLRFGFKSSELNKILKALEKMKGVFNIDIELPKGPTVTGIQKVEF